MASVGAVSAYAVSTFLRCRNAGQIESTKLDGHRCRAESVLWSEL